MTPLTVNDIFFAIVERRQERIMLVREGSRWTAIATREFHRNVSGMVRGLKRWGLEKGDRLAILSENRPEWTIADFAALLLGLVVVPIYTTLTAQQTAYILSDSGAKVVVVSTAQQLEKVLSIKDQTVLERVLIMDGLNTPQAEPLQRLMCEGSFHRDTEVDFRAHAISADDLASIVYTSGTTGVAKGVQLTHGNLTSNVLNSLKGFDIGPGDISISFLPLSHVTARHADLALLYRGATLAYCPFFEQLPQTMLDVLPTIFVAVPRVYEKIHSQVEEKANRFLNGSVYRWALSVGRSFSPDILAGQRPDSIRWRLANKLVFSKLRARMGGRVRIFVSGGAPLGKEMASWYASMGIRIHEGYGLTETSPVIAINTPLAHKIGTVGRPLANVEVRIAEDAEILVRGPSVFQGYWKRPEDTDKTFVDGWFRTGDIGNLDKDGFLSVTDRKKDLLKTSGGKFIAPQPIENSIKLNSLIGAAVVLGDRRKFASVIISPHFPLLEEWAKANGVSFSSRQQLIADPKVVGLFAEIVAEVNRGLARYETLKKILLVADEFTASDGTLTPTFKLRRKAVEERYRKEIDELYSEAEEVSSLT